MEIEDNADKGPLGGLGILSSYESTTFFVLQDNTLYISEEYFSDEQPMLAIYAFICAAMGTFEGVKFALPKVKTTFEDANPG